MHIVMFPSKHFEEYLGERASHFDNVVLIEIPLCKMEMLKTIHP